MARSDVGLGDFSRAEAVYRATVDPHSAGKEGAQ